MLVPRVRRCVAPPTATVRLFHHDRRQCLRRGLPRKQLPACKHLAHDDPKCPECRPACPRSWLLPVRATYTPLFRGSRPAFVAATLSVGELERAAWAD